MGVFDDVLKIKKHAIIFHEGDESSLLYLIKKGKVRIVKQIEGRIIPLALLDHQNMIGEASIFSNESSRSATAIAMEPTELLAIKKSDVKKVIRECPEWVGELMETLSDRLKNVTQILSEHNISNDLSVEDQLSPEDTKAIKKAIEDFVNKRS